LYQKKYYSNTSRCSKRFSNQARTLCLHFNKKEKMFVITIWALPGFNFIAKKELLLNCFADNEISVHFNLKGERD
jgi:hypothetical protein